MKHSLAFTMQLVWLGFKNEKPKAKCFWPIRRIVWLPKKNHRFVLVQEQSNQKQKEKKKMEKGKANWSEEVEDLVTAGDTQGAISFLENLVSKLETTPSSDDLQLASALSDLAALYSSIGYSLKSDQLFSRASLLKQRAHSSRYSFSLSLPFSFLSFLFNANGNN